MSKLEELTAAGMNPRYVTQKLIVDNYHDILVARGYRRTWQEIAEALGVPHGKVALASAWARTRKAVASEKLVIPKRAATKPAIASHVFSSLRPDRYFISATARLWSAGYPLRSGYAQLWDERATDGTDMVWTAHGSLPLSTDMVWSLHYCHDNGTVGTYGGQIVGAAS